VVALSLTFADEAANSRNASGLSEARFQEKVCVGTLFWRAIEPWTKPTAVAADAGPMGIERIGGSVSRWAGPARWGITDGRGRGTVVGEEVSYQWMTGRSTEKRFIAREDAEVLQVLRHPRD
jgi:hypothetical protein